jgi:hypothetical protein
MGFSEHEEYSEYTAGGKRQVRMDERSVRTGGSSYPATPHPLAKKQRRATKDDEEGGQDDVFGLDGGNTGGNETEPTYEVRVEASEVTKR